MRVVDSIQSWPFALRLFVLASALLSVSAAIACSTVAFTDPQRPLLAYNFDFEASDAGFLLVNPATASKHSVMGANAARWYSRFGSVSVNQIGPGMPAAGMNTAGLVVTLMWNDEAVYAGNGSAPIVSELELIQRLLDTSASVDEALSQLEAVNVRGLVPIHYFLFDARGSAAVVTPTATGLTVNRGDGLPVPALTNTSYEAALQQMQTAEVLGTTLDDKNSLDRFKLAAAATRTSEPVTKERAFMVLERLANSSTRWQIVFDPVERQITLRLAGSDRKIHIDLSTVDFSCRPQPHGTNLRMNTDLPSATDIVPIKQAGLTESMREVLLSMSATAHLGTPEVAQDLSAGLLAASSCTE